MPPQAESATKHQREMHIKLMGEAIKKVEDKRESSKPAPMRTNPTIAAMEIMTRKENKINGRGNFIKGFGNNVHGFGNDVGGGDNYVVGFGNEVKDLTPDYFAPSSPRFFDFGRRSDDDYFGRRRYPSF